MSVIMVMVKGPISNLKKLLVWTREEDINIWSPNSLDAEGNVLPTQKKK